MKRPSHLVDPVLWREDVEARYVASDDLVPDAFDWLAGCGEYPAELVDAVVAWFRRSRRFETTLDDLMDADEEAS